jgi:hypothetical protein
VNRMRMHSPRLVAAILVLAVAITVFAGISTAHAATAQTPSYFNGKDAVRRAAEWTDAQVPYSQTSWRDGYRTDCSGLISKAWNLDRSFVTWSLPEIAKRISKDELQPGDIILNTERHVIVFGGWADKNHSSYVAFEQVGGQFHRGTRRVVSYPYDTPTRNDYKPYRYTGGHSLDAPGNTLPAPLLLTYSGNGSSLVPFSGAEATNAKIMKVAAKRNADAKAKRAAEARKRRADADRAAQAEAEHKAAEASAAAAAHRTAANASPIGLAAMTAPTTVANAPHVEGTILGHLTSQLLTVLGF